MNTKNIYLILLYSIVLSLFFISGCGKEEISDKNNVIYQGRIMEMTDNNNFVVRIVDGKDLIALSITDDVKFSSSVSKNFKIGSTITFEAGQEVMESWPLQVKLIQIHKNVPPTYFHIKQDKAKEIMDTEDVIIVDVREQHEYDAGYIENAILLPVGSVEQNADNVIPSKDATYLVYCKSGNRSKAACEILIDLGYENVYEMGGVSTWPYELVK